MIISRTPLRISFFGGGTDYPEWLERAPGATLGTSIDKYVYVSCRYLPPFFDHSIRISYSKTECVRDLRAIQHPAVRECLDFMGVTNSVEIHHDSDLPARTGLGSSSAFTVGMLHALHAYKGAMVTKERLARDAIHVEQERIGEKVGCQDQILTAYGGFKLLEFVSAQSFSVTPITTTTARLQALQQSMLLIYTGTVRTASDVVETQLAMLDQRVTQLTAMYHLVRAGADALLGNGPIEEFGRLLHEGWMLKKSLSPRVSTCVVDQAYEAARNEGAIGGKLLGAGGGGFLLLFAQPESHPRIIERLKPLVPVHFNFESTGTQIIFYDPNGPSH